MSSAPASSAVDKTSSSLALDRSTVMMPCRSNIQETEPAPPSDPPYLVNRFRISLAARLRLSVRTSTSTANPPGAYPSYKIVSNEGYAPGGVAVLVEVLTDN